jgi:hypothetical protein
MRSHVSNAGVLVTTAVVLIGLTRAAHAADAAFTSGYITYDDAFTAAVSVYNLNPLLDAEGDPNPPCPVSVDLVDGNNDTIATEDLMSAPGRDSTVEIPVAAPMAPGASIRVDVSYAKGKLCSNKSLHPVVSFQEPGFDQANRYEVSVSRGSRTR